MAVAAPRLPTIVVEPRRGLFQLDLGALWEYRELLYFLVWRDLKVRYKQTVIGIGWAILQPLITMAIFTVIFAKFAKIPSDGIPYPLFVYTGLLPWTYFSKAVGTGGTSLVMSANLISKIYFPRLVIPSAAVITPAVDFVPSFLVLLAFMSWFGVYPGWAILALPVLMVVALFTALAVGLFLSSLNVRYRDVGHAIPFVIQVWMYASPVAYPVSLVPEKWRFVYGLNPLVGVVEGFRSALLGHQAPDLLLLVASFTMVVCLTLAGVVYFKYTERTFADII